MQRTRACDSAQVTMSKHFGTLTLTALAALAHFVSGQSDGSQQTALDEYVFSDESLSQYSYSHVSEYDFEGINSETNEAYQAYVINMTSGEWRTGKKLQQNMCSDIVTTLYIYSM